MQESKIPIDNFYKYIVIQRIEEILQKPSPEKEYEESPKKRERVKNLPILVSTQWVCTLEGGDNKRE